MPQSHGITLGRKEEKRGDGKVKDDSGLLAGAPGRGNDDAIYQIGYIAAVWRPRDKRGS